MNVFIQKLVILFGLLSFLPYTPLSAQCDSMAIDLPYNGIDEDCDYVDGQRLHMPSNIYLCEGRTFDFFYRNVFLSKHPSSYTFSISTTLQGEDLGDHWHFVPSLSDVGEHSFTFEIKNNAGLVLASASSTVRVAAAESPANATGKKFIQMGHSLVDQGVMAYYLAQHVADPGTPPVTFHGTRISYLDNMTRHQGLGGASWNFYHTDPQSPFVKNGALDMRSYFDSVICTGCNPDLIVIQLDVNDYCFTGFLSGKTFEEIYDYIQADYETHIMPVLDAFQAAAPNMKIGICLPPPANGRPGVFLNHFGPGTTLTDHFRWQKIVNGIYHKYTEFFDGRTDENIYVIPIHLGVDDYNHFDDVDPIHPYPSNGDITKPNGYRSAALSMFAWIKQMMADEVASCRLEANIKNIVCDNNGTESNPNDDTFTFDMKVVGQNVSNGYNALIGIDVATGSYGDYENFGPLAVGIQGALITDKQNDICPVLVPISKEACSFGTVQLVDLDLEITAANVFPSVFTTFPVTYTITNSSTSTALAVWAKIPKPSQVNFPGGDPFIASQGTFDWFYTYLWEVGDIPAGGTATLTVDYYLIADEIFPFYAEIYSAFQPDPDSAPHNGDYINVNEDDEAILMLGVSSTPKLNLDKASLSLYPNPVSGELLGISLKNTNQTIQSVEILDAQGRICQSKQGQTDRISTENLARGIYLLRVRLENGLSLTERFVRM